MGGSEQDWVAKAFEANFIAPVGPQLDLFEEKVSAYLGRDLHCVAVSSGTAALHLALLIADVESGDEVWVSSMTFAGGVFPISYLNATPVFFDLNPRTWTIDVDLVEEKLDAAAKRGCLPKAIIPTDLYGQSVDLTPLELVADKYGVSLIVDSAESFGAEYRERRKAGTGGDAAILSFNGNKMITTSGGGLLVTKHRNWAKKARFLSTQARDPAPHYQHTTIGYNYRMSNVSAAIGLGQLEVLEQRVLARREIFDRYNEALSHKGVEFMPELEGTKSSRWLTTIKIDPTKVGFTREELRLSLLDKGIESRPLWKPMHLQPVYSNCNYVGNNFDKDLFDTGLCLPSGSDMTLSEQTEVIEHIMNFVT